MQWRRTPKKHAHTLCQNLIPAFNKIVSTPVTSCGASFLRTALSTPVFGSLLLGPQQLVVLASAWCTLTVLEICNLQRMPCSSRASTNWGAFCCCLLNDISQAQAQLHASARLQPPSLLLSQVFLRMTPWPGVILSARPQNCYKLMAELMAGSFLSPCAVPCQRIGRAPPPVKLAKIEAEIRAPFLTVIMQPTF